MGKKFAWGESDGMIRLNLLAEGKSEVGFAKSVLAPYLASRDVFVHPIAVLTSKDMNRQYRGGVISYVQVKADLLRLIKRDRADSTAWFTTMIDLYKLPSDFPAYASSRSTKDCRQRVNQLETAFAADINCHRFIPFIQLHEYEALLLADVEKMSYFYSEATYQPGIEALKNVTKSFASPELINDGEQTAPSKRIIAQIPNYEDEKTSAGVQIAQQIGLVELRRKCEHFGKWVTQLESL